MCRLRIRALDAAELERRIRLQVYSEVRYVIEHHRRRRREEAVVRLVRHWVYPLEDVIEVEEQLPRIGFKSEGMDTGVVPSHLLKVSVAPCPLHEREVRHLGLLRCTWLPNARAQLQWRLIIASEASVRKGHCQLQRNVRPGCSTHLELPARR